MKKTWYEVGVSYKNGETESLESRESLANAIDLANSITLDMKQADYLFVDKWACTECDSPKEEVEWLLEKLYEGEKPKLTFKEAYGDVLAMLEESEVV